mmetsp:Transcript_28541/g.64726  ORF Transcript_28541/g.64726 Transcript_28541/m.64726 type:complete len:130 (-) Transcript_28541:125-514(-)
MSVWYWARASPTSLMMPLCVPPVTIRGFKCLMLSTNSRKINSFDLKLSSKSETCKQVLYKSQGKDLEYLPRYRYHYPRRGQTFPISRSFHGLKDLADYLSSIQIFVRYYHISGWTGHIFQTPVKLRKCK